MVGRTLCGAPGGRDITMTAISGGVYLSIKDANAAAAEFSWTITASGGAITFLRQDNASPANALRHVVYSHSGNVWTRADLLTGAYESLEATDDPPDDEQDTWEKSEWLTFKVAGQTLSGSFKTRTQVGKGEVATWRETGRSEWDGQVSGWRNTSMSYWQDNLNPLVNGLPMIRTSEDGSWEYRQYDPRGRETLRAQPLDGDSTPYSFFWAAPSFAVSNGAAYLWPFDAIVTTTSYDPPPGDSGAWQDSRQPRETCRYAIKDGVFTLTARAWSVFSRGTHDGWPSRTRAAIRAATSSAIFAAPANARAVSVAVIDDADDVPVLMRSRPLYEEQTDGTLRTWSYLYTDTDSDGTNDVLEITTRSGTTMHTNGLAHISTYTIARLDAVFGRLLYRETRLYTGGGSDPVLDWEERQYDDKGRHIRSDFSDGTSEEKAWGCCRMESSWGRDGSLREYLAIPGEDHWSAVAEPALGALPGANGRYPVNESFTDALGRETNAVRAVWQNTSRDAAYAPLQTRTEYPLGTDHYRVVTDPLGIQTVSRNYLGVFYGGTRMIDETSAPGITNRYATIPGGATITLRQWSDPVTGVAHRKATRSERTWTRGSHEVRTQSVSRDNGPWQTESSSESDFLGRTAAPSSIGANCVMLVTSNFYDRAGRLVHVQRPDGSSEVYVYDELGERRAVIRVGAGQSLAFDPLNFTLSAVITLNTYVIDEMANWKEYSDLGLSANGVPTTWWNSDAAILYLPGNGAVTTSVTRTQMTGLSQACLNRTVATDGNGVSFMATTSLNYGRQATTRITLANGATETDVAQDGHAISHADAFGATTTYRYDGFARQIATTRTADDRTLQSGTSFHADGSLAASVQLCGAMSYTNAFSTRQYLPSPEGAYIVTETDFLGNETLRYYAADGTLYRSEGAVYPVATALNADGRQSELHTLRDENGHPDITRWHYDRAGMVTNKVYADGLGPSYTHLADGRLSARVWARGVTTAYGYSNDADGRMQSVTFSEALPNVTSRYDLAGRLISVTDSTGARSFSYDAQSRQTAETNALAVIERQYDALGRSAGYDLILPAFTNGTFAIRYAYDTVGRFSQVSNSELQVAYSYIPGSDLIAGVTNDLGYGLLRAYEPCRDLITVVSNVWNLATIASFLYQNDAAGRRTQRIDGDAVTNLFGYNVRSELTAAEMATTAYSFLYDDIGNRISSAVSAPPQETFYTANQLNQYTEIRSTETNAPTYDADGNMLTCGPWTYGWDGENRLVTVFSNGTLVVSNAYDYMSRRVQKTTIITTTHFIWDGWNIVAKIAVDRQTGAMNLTRYVWGLDLSGTRQGAGGVGGLLAVVRDGELFYPCYDANGNVTDYVNAAGTVVAHYEYSPFGEIVAQSGILADAFACRFSTKFHDAETGLVMYQLRPYSPPLGQWLSRDPVGEKGGLNLSQFVRNDPIRFIDYLGREPVVGGKPAPSMIDFNKCVKWRSEVQYETFVYVPMHLMLPIPRRHAVYWAVPQVLSGSAPAKRYRTAALDDACYFEARKLTVYAEPKYGFDSTGDCRLRNDEGILRYEPLISITREGGSPRWEPTWSDFRMLWRYADGIAPGTRRHCDYRFYGATEARLVVHRKIKVHDADEDIALSSLNFQIYATPIGDPPPPPSER